MFSPLQEHTAGKYAFDKCKYLFIMINLHFSPPPLSPRSPSLRAELFLKACQQYALQDLSPTQDLSCKMQTLPLPLLRGDQVQASL